MKNLAIAQASTELDATAFENLIIKGDLSHLSPAQRTIYYKAVCETLGLNPLTKPFEYITLNGRMVLYALKACTEQLRKLYGISITIAARESTDGVYVVTARATRSDGRQDESVGAVPIDKVQGEARANAMMKAETKAKRRVTLSICGLGMLDETEVESITSEKQEAPPNDHLWPKALTKAQVQEKKEAGQLKGQRQWHQPIPESVIEDVEPVDDEPPAILTEPEPKAGAAWLEHKRAMTADIDRGDFQARLEAIPQQVAEKIAKDSGAMFLGTCEAQGCSAVLVTGKSTSEKFPGREYIVCHHRHQEAAKMRKEGKTERQINGALKDHTRYWKDETEVPF